MGSGRDRSLQDRIPYASHTEGDAELEKSSTEERCLSLERELIQSLKSAGTSKEEVQVLVREVEKWTSNFLRMFL